MDGVANGLATEDLTLQDTSTDISTLEKHVKLDNLNHLGVHLDDLINGLDSLIFAEIVALYYLECV
jgi:hypothetical protein